MPSHKRLADLNNLNEDFESRLLEVGIATPADLKKVGPVKAYRMVKDLHPKETDLVFLYSLQGALWDMHWNTLPKETRDKLRADSLSILDLS